MNSQNQIRNTPARQIISTTPLRSVIHLNGCKLTEVFVDGSWVCIKVEELS
ncbi:TPA: hypothetical protein ACK3Q6_003707 [Burkholderia cepacia]|jgi:hypothetical protein|uniref:Uncharacterized protein n=3 Tax=Burkholderia cepacia complex TaxID=87882 RepID=A0A6J5JF90_9BURK|nr:MULTISPECIES: hypothetical protein [Burkholderia]HDR9764179.1 hypothetical protein [Burkholderia cepacia ATCC 25416]HDV6369950.1 hypothetical protein [Burkholderia cepacia]MBK1902279.1 hypothetical protein [Burkholderia contaminans]MBK1910562.1 hypothetical protein [Burkholderia contaminans]MBK1923650.1 hypothetical protein [Burkholderia contaminans]